MLLVGGLLKMYNSKAIGDVKKPPITTLIY